MQKKQKKRISNQKLYVQRNKKTYTQEEVLAMLEQVQKGEIEK